MAIVKMKQLRLIAMREDREDLLHLLQRMGCVEIDEPRVDPSDPLWSSLSRPGGEGLAQARERKEAGEQALEVLKRYAPEKGGMLRARPVVTESELFAPEACAQAKAAVEQINDAQRCISTLQTQKNKLFGEKSVLAPWLELDIPLETQGTRETRVHFGAVPSGMSLDTVRQALLEISDLMELQEAGRDRDRRYFLLICHASVEEELLDGLKQFGWIRVSLKGWTGTAAENNAKLDQQMEQVNAQLTQTEQNLAEQGARREEIYRDVDRAAVDINREDARGRLVETGRTFFLEGWLPDDCWERTRKELERFDCAFQAIDPPKEDYPNVPVKLKNNWFTQPMNMVVEMYSLPAYGSLDPNPLMAPFFILFYGLMMADMGYGLLMLLGAWFILKKMKPKGGMKDFGGLIGLCGVSTFLFGALTGGFFGDFIPQLLKLFNPESTFTLPYLFTPLTDTIMILIGSLVLGVIQIFTGMAISVFKKFRDGNWQDALWNEFTWWVILGGAALAILGIGNVAGYPAVLILGLVMLVYGSTKDQKGFGKVTSLIGVVYNGVTGYFSDTLSYARLMALMLAGSVIAQVFNTLGSVTGNVVLFVLISFVGNMLNFALNLLGCYVHDLRLQCLEFFNRFYEEGGKPFRPMEMETKYVDVIEQK